MLKRRDLIAAFAVLAFAGAASAQDSVDLAKAKAEGKVVWYTSTPLPQAQKIVNLFEKKHGIKVEMFRSSGSAILRRFQQEVDAGRIAADVLTTTDPAAAAMLTRIGIIVAFKPKNFDKVPDAAKDQDGNFVDHDGQRRAAPERRQAVRRVQHQRRSAKNVSGRRRLCGAKRHCGPGRLARAVEPKNPAGGLRLHRKGSAAHQEALQRDFSVSP